ncbi:hypothetical protein [Haloglomus salinum]|jgi:hypothetical protein|uniref:hypothetical protein n=1 Tax=Haloglomus salinum TaxID=2962673 RepID=UPI0020C94744|nr:hypothetical protein [Haloglomus salinum]
MSPSGDATGRWGSRRRLLLGGVVLLLALAGCGSPQPAPEVCYGCSDNGAVRGLPSNATTGDSVTHLYLVPASGDEPRVEARTRVGLDAAEAFRTNASRREAVRRAVLAARDADSGGPDGPSPTPTPRYQGPDGRPTYPVAAFEARDLSVGTETDSLVVDFRVAGIPGVDAAETPPLVGRGPGGTVLVDRFNVRDGRNPHPGNDGFTYTLATDRLVVHAPPGTRPVVAPDDATVYDDRVVLRSLPADTNLVFAPEGSTGTLAAHATLTADRLGWVVPDSFWVALLPTLQLGLLLSGIRAGEASGTRYAIGALLLALLLTLGPFALFLGPLGLVGVGLVLLVALALLWRAGGAGSGTDESGPAPDGSADATGSGRRLPTLAGLRAGIEPWLAPVAGVVVAVSLLTVVAAAAGGGPVAGLLFVTGGVLPIAGTLGLGWLARRAAESERPSRLLVSLILVAPWLLAVGYVAGRGIPDSIEAVTLVLVWGTGVTLVGYVAYRVSARFAPDPDADDDAGDTD